MRVDLEGIRAVDEFVGPYTSSSAIHAGWVAGTQHASVLDYQRQVDRHTFQSLEAQLRHRRLHLPQRILRPQFEDIYARSAPRPDARQVRFEKTLPRITFKDG